MPSIQYLREFINERLTAAAEQIFLEFEKTIVQYEEEIDRQRRLLDITWKPKIKLHRTDIPQQHVCKEEVLPEQQLWNKERSSSLDQAEPEPPQIKEEQEEICSSQEGERLGLKEEINTVYTYEESDYSEPEPDRDLLLSHSSAETESRDQQGSRSADSGSTRNANQKKKNLRNKSQSDSSGAGDSPSSQTQCSSDTCRKTLKCMFCGKVFKKVSHVKDHHRVHTGEKPFSCKTCGRRFTQNAHLTVHMRTHTGEKPYVCSTCGKGFTLSSALKRHVAVHRAAKEARA